MPDCPVPNGVAQAWTSLSSHSTAAPRTVSMQSLFLVSSVLASCLIGIANWMIVKQVDKVIDDSALVNGQQQMDLCLVELAASLQTMERNTDSYGRYFLSQTHHDLSTPRSIREAFSPSFFLETTTRITTPGELMGWSPTWILPAEERNWNDFASNAPLPSPSSQMRIQSIFTSYDISQNGTKIDYTYSYTQDNGFTNTVFIVNVSAPTPYIQRRAYEVNLTGYWVQAQHYDDHFESVLPWISQDGFVYLYLTYQRRYVMNGVPLLVQTYASVDSWSQLLSEVLEEVPGSKVLVVDRQRHIVATSLIPKTPMRCKYVDSSSSYIDCQLPFASNSTNKVVRDMNAAVSLLPSGQSFMVVKRSLADVTHYVVVYELINKGNLTLYVVWAVSGEASTGEAMLLTSTIISIGCLLVAACAGCVALFGHFGVLVPLRHLTDAMHRIQELDLSTVGAESKPSRITEVMRLQHEFHSMRNVLQSFTKYVPQEVVKALTKSSGLAVLGMQPLELTVMFLDIVKFTAMCEWIATDTLSALLCSFFQEMTHILLLHGATIDKFLGDAIMCFWGAPLPCDTPDLYAGCSALAIRQAVHSQLRPHFANHNVDGFDVRVGIHSGTALCGNMGCPQRITYTAIGRTVQIAAKLETLNRAVNTCILVSQPVADRIRAAFVLRYVGHLLLTDHSRLQVYTLHGLHPATSHLAGSRCRMEVTATPTSSRPPRSRGSLSIAACIQQLAIGPLQCNSATMGAIDLFSDGMHSYDASDITVALHHFRQCREAVERMWRAEDISPQQSELLLGDLHCHAEQREAECLDLLKDMPLQWTPILRTETGADGPEGQLEPFL
eukprot:GGOE01003220.1.p1 GENE.GGOE01003220.1~~GGOE01003220.1.p1  ORF type:complete len:845 (+),score=198.28 GGOE01003220.1:25-2535(+)